MKKKKIEKLCLKSIADELSESEELILSQWIDASPQNLEYYENLKRTWNRFNSIPKTAKPDINFRWNAMEFHLTEKQKYENETSSFMKIKKYWIANPVARYRFVFAICGLFAIIFASVFYFQMDQSHKEMISVSTLEFEKSKFRLPDSSLVLLNKDSIIRFNRDFDDETREIYLCGEAYFEVTKNIRPFVVNTGNSKTTVIGTKFNIRNRQKITEISVREGCLQVSAGAKNVKPVILRKNDVSKIIGQSSEIEVKSQNFDQHITWLLWNKLVFKKQPLKEILSQMEKYYDIKIILKTKSMANEPLTAFLDKLSPDEALKSVCLALDLSYRYEAGQYIVQ